MKLLIELEGGQVQIKSNPGNLPDAQMIYLLELGKQAIMQKTFGAPKTADGRILDLDSILQAKRGNGHG